MVINSLYYFFFILATLGTVAILFTSNILYAILELIFVVLCLSALYFLQGATFIAIVQLIIYVGGMLVLIIASLLFLKPSSANTNKLDQKVIYKIMIGSSILIPFLLLIGYLYKQNIHKFILPTAHTVTGTIQELGYQLLGTYGLAFELISIMILIAFVGTWYIIIQKYINKNG